MASPANKPPVPHGTFKRRAFPMFQIPKIKKFDRAFLSLAEVAFNEWNSAENEAAFQNL